jgi:hypothetical protein
MEEKWMRGTIRRVLKHVQSRWPTLYVAVIQRPRARFRFRDERRAAKGRGSSSSRQQSVMLFTAHKCASVYVSKILATLSRDAGLLPINYEAYFTHTDVSKRELLLDRGFLERAFSPAGYCYGPLRRYYPVPDLERYAVLLVLRDPRDVLTSHYYSIAYSHPVFTRTMVSRRQSALQTSLDEYVLRKAPWLKSRYEAYCADLLERPNVLFLQYEEMVTDFDTWLHKAASHVGLDGDDALLRSIAGEADFEVSAEDRHSHKRQVTPGDHRRKLRPETIGALTLEFQDILERLGYSTGP